MKTCNLCGETKPADQFRYRRCRDCIRELNANRSRRKYTKDAEYRKRKLERYQHRPTPLSKQCKAILAFIEQHEPCRVCEIGNALGLGYSTVSAGLMAIENNGILLYEQDYYIGIFRMMDLDEAIGLVTTNA